MDNLTEALQFINPAALDYQTWLSVGMALKHEGYSVQIWDSWSRNDSRYHEGECAQKWKGFNGNANPVTGATIIQLAKENGMVFRENRALDWNDEISYDFIDKTDEQVIINQHWIEDKEIIQPKDDWQPHIEIIRYLQALFEPEEKVGYVVQSKLDEECGKYKPVSRGNSDRTAEQLIEQLEKCHGDIGAVLGDYNPAAGAWVRFNPLDGKGVKNENVTDFRYALVESDNLDIERQNALIRELELPVAALVYSGGKSLHAIVHIDAANYEEYRHRVDFLYQICLKNGLDPDTQNRNPSRLSRLPGVTRGEQKQFLVETNIGRHSWNDWREWIESINDDLPDFENAADFWDNMPDLAPPLIDGVLRQGHKMLIAGPSKAGKSFALIELCVALAEGKEWLGWKCAQGKVLYVNLELDKASCEHRLKDIYNALGWEPTNRHNIDFWNLRGKSVPMDKLAPKLIRRASKRGYIAIIIDPIYKVITGDENSADQMAHFCNQFDKVCTELGCAVIYCHHHSKGAQGSKRSMDRASGSGVFARDPDALLDLIELEISDGLMKEEQNKAVCNVCYDMLIHSGHSDISQDEMVTAKAMREHVKNAFSGVEAAKAEELIRQTEKSVEGRTAWRIEGTLREFPKFAPVNVWFDYPIHRMDMVGVLKDTNAEGDLPTWQIMNEKRKKQAKQQNDDNKDRFESALQNADFGEAPTLDSLAKYLDISKRTVQRWVTKYGYFVDKNTLTIKKKEDDSTTN